MSDQHIIDDGAAEIIDPAEAKLSEIIQNIEFLMDQFIQERGLESLKMCTQQEYNAGLMYVRFNYFDRDKMILHKYAQGRASAGLVSDMYDDHIIYLLSQYYIYMCGSYNKIANMAGFSYLTGVDLDTLGRWACLESQRPEAWGVAKMLRNAYEIGLENGAQNGKNALGYMAALNHRFRWSDDQKTGVTINITRDKRQIMSTYGDDLLIENGAK